MNFIRKIIAWFKQCYDPEPENVVVFGREYESLYEYARHDEKKYKSYHTPYYMMR